MKIIQAITVCTIVFLFLTTEGCSKPNVVPQGTIPIAGQWYVEFNTNDVGYVRTVMTFEQDGEKFEAYSHEGAASEIVGWFKLLMAKLFTHYFSHGSLLHFLDGQIKPASDSHSMIVTATFASALGDMDFSGTVDDSTMTGTLTDGGRVVGKVWGSRRVHSLPLDDYPALVDRIRTMTEQKIYGVKLLDAPEWKNFIATLKDGATHSQDDADMIFKFFQTARSLPFTHFYLFGSAPDSTRAFHAEAKNENAWVTMRATDSGYTVLRIRSFAGDARPIDSCFEQIVRSGVSALIIDLRGNTGGNVSAMRVAAHLTDRSYAGGAFVTRKWFDAHSAPPTLEQMNAFPQLTEANVDLLFKGIHEQDGLSIRVMPDSLRYIGRVYVLVDERTASACEPLTYALKEYKLAKIVGENTAGAMLNGEEFSLGGGWMMTIPTADYYTAEGERLDKRGVAPDVMVKSADAMNTVKGWIENPSAAPPATKN